jgi:tyrosyl-tRNA synthetase
MRSKKYLLPLPKKNSIRITTDKGFDNKIMKNFIEELRQRGMLHDVMPETEAQLQKEMSVGYIGFDPTASSLHIGNLATIMLLKNLQICGHKPIALVGGATGMIGDPSGKSAERNLLNEEILRHNQTCIHQQLSKFLDFDCGANSAEIVNNYDWFKSFSFLDFLRDVGKHLTVNYMMAKDSVKNRLETGISFTEFSYQLLQAYDYYYLYQHKNVKLQMGGSDQWGNITSGTELIRRMTGGTAFALTTPLVTKADGSKFGKSESGNVWLDPEMTSPYKFYQFWLNCTDEDSHRLIRVYTLLSLDEIAALEASHAKAPHLRILQKAIAEDVTVRVHGRREYEKAVQASEILFGKELNAIQTIDEKTLLAVFEGVPQVKITKNELEAAPTISDLLSSITKNEIFASKGEAKKMISGGGVSINREKINSPEDKPALTLLQGKYLLVQKGKKNYYLVECL